MASPKKPESLTESRDLAAKEKSKSLMERERLLLFWENSRKELEEKQARLCMLKKRKEEQAVRHLREVSEFRQKLKHVLLEHHNLEFEQKAESNALMSQAQVQGAQTEIELRRKLQKLQDRERLKAADNKLSLYEQELNHRLDMIKINNHYEAKYNEIVELYDQKMKNQIEEALRASNMETYLLEDERETQVEELKFRHQQDLEKITAFNLRVLARMNEQENKINQKWLASKRAYEKAERRLEKANEKKKHLTAVLKNVEEEGERLRADYEAYQQTKEPHLKYRQRQIKKKKEEKRKKVEEELLLQASIAAKQEQERQRKQKLKMDIDRGMQHVTKFMLQKMSQNGAAKEAV